jgi:hypothetical protein
MPGGITGMSRSRGVSTMETNAGFNLPGTDGSAALRFVDVSRSVVRFDGIVKTEMGEAVVGEIKSSAVNGEPGCC